MRPLIALLALWLLGSPAGLAAAAAGETPDRKAAQPPAPVAVAAVVARRVTDEVTLVGTAEPQRRSLVASDVEGIVADLMVKEGTPVRRGDRLAQLRTDSLEIQLRGARAQRERFRHELTELEAGFRVEEVEEARAAAREAEASAQRAQREVVRQRELHADGATALQTLQDAETAHEAARQRLEQVRARLRMMEAGARRERIDRARAELQAAEAEVARLGDEISRMTIVAPFDGVVTAEHTQRGQWVAKGGPVVEIVDLSRVEIAVPFPERAVGRLRHGIPAEVRFDALGDRASTGEVIAIVPQGDVASRTFRVKVRVANPDRAIKAGMFARVSFGVGGTREAILVPKDAVVHRAGTTLVYVVNGEMVHELRVQTGAAQGGAVEVAGGLRPGQVVVVRGNERLRDGQRVQVQGRED
jgi:multidrug efflux pump subunit AcrA (membrane-fusion protein)